MNLPEDIAKFRQEFMKEAKDAPAKISTRTTSRREGKHKHFTPGDRGYAPRGCSNPVNIRIAKRR